MLTAIEISEGLKRSLDEGCCLAIISIMAEVDRPVGNAGRLLVEEGGGWRAGTLGHAALDDLATAHALRLIADEKQEIAVAGIDELSAPAEPDSIRSAIGREFRQTRLLFEISRPPLQLVICGGGHVGQAVARAARLLDFQVTVIDDRTDFASREKFPDPGVRLLAEDFPVALRSLRITPATHLVIVTRGHRHDEICLREVIDKPARYLGMIGSRRRTTTIRERLRREGIPPELLRSVHAPIGLDIGALTPEEIAFAILSEIILIRRGGTGRPKSADGPMARTR